MGLRCIDLFSGAGGLSTGLGAAGFESVYASEVVAAYARTYGENHPSAVVDVRDIRSVDATDVRGSLGLDVGELDLIAGGPPCQGFSINAPVRSASDPRNHLFREYLRFVGEFLPRAILIENVPGLLSFGGGSTLHAIVDALGGLGYGTDVRILGALYYGVPQTRWRTFVVGLRGTDVPDGLWPEPTRTGSLRANFATEFDGRSLVVRPGDGVTKPFTTLWEAIGDLPVLSNGERGDAVKPYATEPTCDYQRRLRDGSDGVTCHEAPRLSAINMRRLSHIGPGQNWTAIPTELLPKGMRGERRSDHTKRYGRPRWDDVSSTILTKCDPHWGAYFHPSQDRALTVREAARIQSFPDWYAFCGTAAERYAEVGNAVPPMLAEAVGRGIGDALDAM